MSISSPPNNTEITQPQSGRPKGTKLRTASIIGLALVAILALAFAGYTALSPHSTTVTQQQLFTNTQSAFSTKMQTVTSVSQVTQVVTVTNTQSLPGSGVGPTSGYYEYCSAYGCMYPPGPSYNTYNPSSPPNPWYPGYYNGVYYGYWNGNFVQPCAANGFSNNVTCSGYIFQAQNGCTVLVIPVANPYYSESFAYQYYSLRNLPSNIPTNGSWVTIAGDLHQGSNTSSSGASCPGNYINVTSMS